MSNGAKLFALLLPFLLFSACAAKKQPDPLAPLKEDISLLQKQHLELQKQLTETQIKLEESTAAVQNLASRLQALEGKKSSSGSTRPDKTAKQNSKKKKSKTRR
jgi:uncharacterized coiled-coil protein SlyX